MMMNEGTEMNASMALRMIALTSFRPFNSDDWVYFAGCESKTPLIGEFEEFLIVLDGSRVEILVSGEDDVFQFSLNTI